MLDGQQSSSLRNNCLGAFEGTTGCRVEDTSSDKQQFDMTSGHPSNNQIADSQIADTRSLINTATLNLNSNKPVNSSPDCERTSSNWNR